MRVRIEPTAAYAAQVMDYERRFERTLETVNALLEPSLAVRLELGDKRPFAPAGSEDHIHDLLDELERADAGTDVDWVIGLAGSVPRFEDSFHELGVGEVVGKHLVLRALNDVAEYQAIQAGFTELSEAERDKLIRTRLEHKTAVVLLHELGHTLGALHELDKTNIMNPRYSTSERRFDAQTVEVMRTVLAHRSASGALDRSGKQAVLDLWGREPSPWILAERRDALARFAPPVPEPAASSAPAVVPAGLPSDDEAAFENASRLLAAGDTERALEVAKPLFDGYANVRAVAELRCNIALRRGLTWEVTRQECAALTAGVFGGR